MNNVLFDLAIAGMYLVYFFVTGYLLCRLLDIKRHRFLLSYALSLSIIVGSVALVYLLDLGKWAFLAVLHFALVILIITVLNRCRGQTAVGSTVRLIWQNKEKRKLKVLLIL